MGRRELIAEILGNRIPLSKRIDEVRSYTQDLVSALRGLDALSEEYERFDGWSDVQSKAVVSERILTEGIQSALDSQLENLQYLHERFSKPPLKIAVAGLPKEGKSTFIRAVTGLPEDAIPSSQDFCTGAPYTIYNHETDETFAWVDFYSSDDFLQQVIQPYYDDRDLELPDKPISLDAWKKPSLLTNDGDAVTKAKYQRLLAYYEAYPSYKNYLNKQRIRVEKNEIRTYIAQVSDKGEKIDIYRSVKSADIYTNFPNEDVGKIALVDTPGVGELRIKEEEKLVKFLRKSADIVICVILPRSNEFTYQARHADFFRLMQKGIGQAEKRCLLVLNDDGKNSEACSELAKPEKLQLWGLEFAQVFTANCSQREQVGSAVVDPTLDYLAKNIKFLDQYEVKHSFDVLLKQSEESASLLKKVYVDTSGNIQYISSQRYRKLFETSFLPELRAAFKEMRVRFLAIQDRLSVKSVVIEKVKSLAFNIPDAENIEFRRNPKDTYDPVFEEILGQLRVQALRHFQNLDLELKPLADELRKIVTDELGRIGLGKLSDKDESLLLEEIYHLLPESCQMLRLAFRVLKDFELAYFWLIRVKIYEGLEVLLPEKNRLKPKSSDPIRPTTAEVVYQALNESCIKARSDLQALLGGDATDDFSPNSAALAVLDEFIDLAFYAGDDRGRGVLLGEWQDFIEPYRARIWQQNFDNLEEEIKLRDRLSKLMDRARYSTGKLQQLVRSLEETP